MEPDSARTRLVAGPQHRSISLRNEHQPQCQEPQIRCPLAVQMWTCKALAVQMQSSVSLTFHIQCQSHRLLMKAEWKVLEERACVGFGPPSTLPAFLGQLPFNFHLKNVLSPTFCPHASVGTLAQAHQRSQLQGLRFSQEESVCVHIQLQKPNGNRV